MYFVDQGKLERQLEYMHRLYEFMITLEGNFTKETEILALERAIQMSIEAMLDVGNQMIDGFIMRDPGSYEDIIDIMQDEQVLPKQEAKQLVQFVALRKKLVTDYTEVESEELWQGFVESKQALKVFPERIRTYLAEHLGPVSAFIPKENKDD